MSIVNVQQCINVKFCVKLGKFVTEMYDLLEKVYGDECLSSTQVFETISVPVIPTHQKQTLTLKKSVILFDKIVA